MGGGIVIFHHHEIGKAALHPRKRVGAAVGQLLIGGIGARAARVVGRMGPHRRRQQADSRVRIVIFDDFPSIASPNGFTILPSNSIPTGTVFI